MTNKAEVKEGQFYWVRMNANSEWNVGQASVRTSSINNNSPDVTFCTVGCDWYREAAEIGSWLPEPESPK